MKKLIIAFMIAFPTISIADCIKDGNCTKIDDNTYVCSCSEPVVNNVDVKELRNKIDELQLENQSFSISIDDLNLKIKNNKDLIQELKDKIIFIKTVQ